MYDTFYNVLKLSLNYQQLIYIDTDSFIISWTEGNIPDEYMDLSNLDIQIKTNNEVTGKIKCEFRSKIIIVFLVLSSKPYRLTCREHSSSKEKGVRKDKNRRNRFEEKLRKKEYSDKIVELFDPLSKTLNAYGEKNFSIGNQALDVLKVKDGEAQANPQSSLTLKSFEFPQSIFSNPLTMPKVKHLLSAKI